MLSVLNTDKDTSDRQSIDSVRLDKVVKALMFVAGHIRQVGDQELANRIETSAYEVLLSAYKDKSNYEHIIGYVSSLLSIAIDKQYMSPSTLAVFLTGLKAVFYKRQNVLEYETHINSFFDGVVKDDEAKQSMSFANETTERYVQLDKPATRQEAVLPKKDKIQFVTNVHKLDDKRQSERRQEIMRTLSKTPVSIKDISTHVLGCSEKTIQRELNNLVDDGLVERVGEKRWSRYIIKN